MLLKINGSLLNLILYSYLDISLINIKKAIIIIKTPDPTNPVIFLYSFYQENPLSYIRI